MHKITIGVLSVGQKYTMPLKIYDTLNQSPQVIVCSRDIRAVDALRTEGLSFDVFDDLTGSENASGERQVKIVTDLIARVEQSPIALVVSERFYFNEFPTKDLLKHYENTEVIDAEPGIDDLFDTVNVNPLNGVQVMSSVDFEQDMLQTGQPVFITRVHDLKMAGALKKSLMVKYPKGHKVAVITAAGTTSESVRWMPLNSMDAFNGMNQDFTVYCPPLSLDEQVTSLSTLQHYIDQVTAPDGDVWINEQTSTSLIKYLKEETGELVEAIEKEDTENWMEELGDVLVQILYQTNVAEKEGLFSFEDVLSYVNRKIRRRHPHVFDGVQANTPEEVDAIWQKIKQEEKRKKNET